jgi:ribonuclease P protein component
MAASACPPDDTYSMRDERARSGHEAQLGRLTKRPEFLAAASGRRFHTERMMVQGRLRDDAGGLRFGLTVTKKIGHATERNRIRRRLRAAIHSAAVDHRERSADVVVIGRRESLSTPYPLLVEDLRRALGIVLKAGTRRPVEAFSPSDGEGRGSPHA